jgi:hypothetical protein
MPRIDRLLRLAFGLVGGVVALRRPEFAHQSPHALGAAAQELSPPHSITSSARARRVGGIPRPSAFAVRMLMNSWNFECW